MGQPDVAVDPVTELAVTAPVTATPLMAEVQDRLAAALAALDGLEQRPVADHVALLEAAHVVLRETLEDPPPPRSTTPSG